MQIEDDKSNIILTMTKIESKLNYLAEARNHLHMKDQMLSAAQRHNEKDIETFEKEIISKRREKILKANQEENERKTLEDKERQRLKAEQMKNITLFKGRPLNPRSQKKAFKPKVVKIDNMDEQTKDEKEYLGSELFAILQQVKQEYDIEE